MLLTIPSGRVFMVHFHHEPVIERLWDWTTSVTIHEGLCTEKKRPCGTQGSATGVAHSSKKDVFDKAKGRKTSLLRAMLALGIPKATRKELWADYHKITPPKIVRHR